MNETMINQMFYIEKIDASEEEIDLLRTIGIKEGVKIVILGKGYLEGSFIINVDNKLLQLNPHFVKKIHGSLIDEKIKNK